MIRVARIAAMALAMACALFPAASAIAAPVRLTTEEAMIASPHGGLKIFVRNKRPVGMRSFSPDRTLVFVHGATYPASAAFDLQLDGYSWMDVIARRGFDVYLIDLPGYGRSTRPASMSRPPADGAPVETTAEAVSDYAAVVDWVLARRHLSKLDAAGWSWGTTIAGGFASEHPDKVNRLVLYAPVWLSPPGVSTPAASTPNPGAYRTVSRDSALKRWLNGVPDGMKDVTLPPAWFDAWQTATWATDPTAASSGLLRAPNGVYQDFTRYWRAGRPTYDPGRITAPTLLVVGEWDQDTPPALVEAMFPVFTHAAWKKLVLIGQGTHHVMMERNRVLLFEAVQSFLEEPGPR